MQILQLRKIYLDTYCLNREKSALTTSTPHVYQINPACYEKGTDEQTQC